MKLILIHPNCSVELSRNSYVHSLVKKTVSDKLMNSVGAVIMLNIEDQVFMEVEQILNRRIDKWRT